MIEAHMVSQQQFKNKTTTKTGEKKNKIEKQNLNAFLIALQLQVSVFIKLGQ